MVTVSGSARRYAQALFSLARDRGTIDAWLSDLERAAALANDPVAWRILTSPAVERPTKQQILDRALPGLDEAPRRLLRLLNSRDRLELLPEVLHAYRRLVLDHRNVAVARVTTAVPLDEATQRLVAERLSRYLGKQVLIEPEVDESILGGVVARVDDLLIDGSIRGRLERLREVLAGTPG